MTASQGFPPHCYVCLDAGSILIGNPPFGDHNPGEVRDCPYCGTDFGVDVGIGRNVRRFVGMDLAEARRSATLSAEAGMPAVLLRWERDAFVEVERFAAASPLVSVKARPYSSWRR